MGMAPEGKENVQNMIKSASNGDNTPLCSGYGAPQTEENVKGAKIAKANND